MIFIKSPREIEIMRRASQIVAEILGELKRKIVPGITTFDLDIIAEELTRKKNARPAFKGYTMAGRVYPCSLCTSVNEEVVHGIPSNRVLNEGDIIGIDFGVIYEGFYGDAAVTVGVGQVSDEARRLMRVAEEALTLGIEELHEGKRLGDLSSVIQKTVETAGFSVVREFVGHGIGKMLHEEPPIPNYGDSGHGPRLMEGMVLGKPSNTNPHLQSSWDKCLPISSNIRLSETSFPLSMYFFAFIPKGLWSFTAFLSISPVDIWQAPNLSFRNIAWVPLPAPGGPKTATRTATLTINP